MSHDHPQIFLSVGEPSGDQHSARLIRALRNQVPDCQFRGFGGAEMREAGCQLDFELTQLAVMGIVEVVPKLREFFRVADIASDIFAKQRPDAVVLADFPGFNWHIAKRAKRANIPVFYYLPPQLWAWASWRISKVRKYVDHVLSVLPFEHDWYKERGIDSTFVGHPFFDATAEKPLDRRLLARLDSADRTSSLVAVLPGSRWHEVHRNWPTMLAAIRELSKRFPTARFAVAAFRDAHCLWCRDQMESGDFDLPIDFFVGKTSEVIEASHCAMMVSGSVSLELMARGTPAAVIYQTSRLTYAVGRTLLRVPSITLPNLIAGETLFPELATAGNSLRGQQFLVDSITRMLGDPSHYHRLCEQLGQLRLKYAQPGASEAAARVIWEKLGKMRSANQSSSAAQEPLAA